MQAAVYDAVLAAADAGGRPYAVAVTRPARGSVPAAVAAAAHGSLAALYPNQQPALHQTYRDYLDRLPAGPDADRGTAIGAATAAAMVQLRTGDGSAATVVYTPASAPGRWQPTPPAFRPPLQPGWGRVTPFLLASPGQVRPPRPPALTSAAYARDLAEIHDVGAVDSSSRTPAQSDTARFWISTAPQLWNQPVQQLVVRRQLTAIRTARAFALLNLAGADAFIASWEAKFEYDQWRPVTGIRAADTDGNPATAADPAWSPLLVTPPFPDYPSAHAGYAGAAETVLSGLLGEHPGRFEITSPTAAGIVHGYTDFHAVAAEVVDARVWGGVHWRSSDTVGRTMGRAIGRYALRR